MLRDDIIYVLLLLICIGVGQFYRKIPDPCARQWVGTGIGIVVVLIASGGQIIHPLFCTLVNAIIVTRLSSKICHVASFGFTFSYLLGFFRLADWYGLSLPSGHTNLVQMILTLKLVGLAFEINSALTDDPAGAYSEAFKKVGFLDVFHYGFSYVGVLTGPYYRYRTYWDSLHRPFANHVDHWQVTRERLIEIALMIIVYLVVGAVFPIKYVTTDEFAERSLLYKFFYCYPTLVTFKMRIYTGMKLSECVCAMAGLGAYPTSCETVSGLGPKNYEAMKQISKDPDRLKRETCDLETVHNISPTGVESCFTVRTAMKRWNTCTQYWMAAYCYKRFPHKGLRTIATFALSALWHGYHAGYYTSICSVTFFLPMEDIYVKFYKQSQDNSLARKGLFCFLWFMKTMCMSYLSISFQLLGLSEVLAYYGNVYYAGHVLVAGLYVLGLIIAPYVLVEGDKGKLKEG